MIFRDSSIPAVYNKIAEFGDNYIVLVKENILNSGSSYDAYVQYFSPSTYYVHITDYKITSGTSYSFDYNTNGMGYVIGANYSFSLDTYAVDNDTFSSELEDRADIVSIFFGQFLCVVCILWIFKQLSRLFFKGGLS